MSFFALKQLDLSKRLILIYAALMLGLKLVAVFTTPFHWDAGYYLNIAMNFAENGQLNPAMWQLSEDAGILTGGGGGYGAVILPYWMEIFGFTALSGRILMYLVSLLSLGIVFWIARQWWGEQAAYWTLAFAVTEVMYFHNYVVRIDALSVLAYVCVLALHIVAMQRQSHGLHFWVGVLAIGTTQFHIIGLAFAGGLALYMFVQQIHIWRQEKRFWASNGAFAYFAGAMLAGFAYLAIFVLPNPTEFFLVPSVSEFYTPPGFNKELLQLTAWVVFAPLEFMLFIVALYFMWQQRTPNYRHYLWIVLGFLIGYAVVSPPVDYHYLGHRWFLIVLGVGEFFHQLTRRRSRVLIVIVVIVMSVFTARRLHEVGTGNLRYRTYPLQAAITEYIQANVDTKFTILAPPPYYRELVDYQHFTTIHNDLAYTVILQDITYDEFLAQQSPQAIIFEQRQLIQDEIKDSVNRYIEQKNFVEVLPDLWVAPELAQTQPQSDK